GVTRPHQAVLTHGCIEWLVAQPSGSNNLFGSYQIRSELGREFDPGFYLPQSGASQSPGIARFLLVPLWLPLVVSLGATTLAWIIDRRLPHAGHCKYCGYDLRKNVSGRCPECGKPIGAPAA